MCLSLVAVALGQQYSPPAASAFGQPAAAQPAVGQPAAPAQGGLFDRGGQQTRIGQPAYGDQRQAMPAPGAPMERSRITGAYHSDNAAGMKSDQAGQPRSELGVWLVESQGPGVEIQRVTPGSAAEQAGLRIGDIILQVNADGAATPQETARLIRQIPIGQRGTLTVWRDGNQQQLPITLQAARERVREMIGNVMRDDGYEVGFRGDNEPRGGDNTRITRLEEKIATLTQQLNAMQQELTTLRSQQGGTQRASYNESTQGGTSPNAATPSSALPPAASPAAPPPGFGATEEKKDVAPPAATPPASEPATTPPATTPPAPAAEKSGTDLFGGAAPPPAATEEQPKAEEKKEESKDATDDLFK
jgi:hypothetical protein